MTAFEINQQIKAIIRRSDLHSPINSRETVAALMVLMVCRHLGVAPADIPAALLAALAGLPRQDWA